MPPDTVGDDSNASTIETSDGTRGDRSRAPGNHLYTIAVLRGKNGARRVLLQLSSAPNERESGDQVPEVNIAEDDQSIPELPFTDVHDTSDEETHVIISVGSGTGKAELFYKQAVKPTLEAIFPKGHENFLTHHTESATTIQELTNDILFPTANAGITLRIILLSGDGGIIDLVNGLLSETVSSNYKPPLVVLLPLGTANALYHSISAGNEDKDTWGLKGLSSTGTSPRRKALPIFTASFSPGARLLTNEARDEEELPQDPRSGRPVLHGAVVFSWAMHASLVADSDTVAYRKFGIDRFKMAANEALYPADGSPPHSYHASVSVLHVSDWTSLPSEKHMYVLATMVSNLEKPFCISPMSKPLDGSLWLVHFGPTSGDEATRLMGLAYQGGKHVEDPMVQYEEIDGLRIEVMEREDRWRRICVDGKIVRLEEGGWVEIRKEEKRVLDVVVE